MGQNIHKLSMEFSILNIAEISPVWLFYKKYF